MLSIENSFLTKKGLRLQHFMQENQSCYGLVFFPRLLSFFLRLENRAASMYGCCLSRSSLRDERRESVSTPQERKKKKREMRVELASTQKLEQMHDLLVTIEPIYQ